MTTNSCVVGCIGWTENFRHILCVWLRSSSERDRHLFAVHTASLGACGEVRIAHARSRQTEAPWQGQEASRRQDAGTCGGAVRTTVAASSHPPARLLLRRAAVWACIHGSYCAVQLSGILQLVCQPNHLQPRVQGVS